MDQMNLFDENRNYFNVPSGKSLGAHPALECVPEMPEDTYQLLKSDIAKIGVLRPIILCDGMILDGRARYKACQELGLECPARFIDDASPNDVVRSLNLYRTHYGVEGADKR